MKRVDNRSDRLPAAVQAELNRDGKPLVVVLTGAGVSAESGIPTFRDANGLWEGHDVMQVASPTGWRRNPELVLKFYNLRRRAAYDAQPNAAHLALQALEARYTVVIVTQNVDDLHERAGSQYVLHLHGEIRKVRSEKDADLIYDIGGDEIQVGDLCEQGEQLRPHIVWFGEDVPNMPLAYEITAQADYFMVIGTSLQVYPAADLVFQAPQTIEKFVIDKTMPKVGIQRTKWTILEVSASVGTPQIVAELLAK